MGIFKDRPLTQSEIDEDRKREQLLWKRAEKEQELREQRYPYVNDPRRGRDFGRCTDSSEIKALLGCIVDLLVEARTSVKEG